MGEGALCPATVSEPEAIVFVAEVLSSRFDHGAINAGLKGPLFAPCLQQFVHHPHCRFPIPQYFCPSININ